MRLCVIHRETALRLGCAYDDGSRSPALMPKTEFLQIRCSPEDRERMQKAADSEHLDLSTWARRILLQTVTRMEERKGSRLKVAEGGQEFSGKRGDRK
jgi:hypothetical protein